MAAALLLLITLPAGGPTIPLAATKLARALTPGAFGCWLGMIIPLGVGRSGHSLGRTDFCQHFWACVYLSSRATATILCRDVGRPMGLPQGPVQHDEFKCRVLGGAWPPRGCDRSASKPARKRRRVEAVPKTCAEESLKPSPMLRLPSGGQTCSGLQRKRTRR